MSDNINDNINQNVPKQNTKKKFLLVLYVLVLIFIVIVLINRIYSFGSSLEAGIELENSQNNNTQAVLSDDEFIQNTDQLQNIEEENNYSVPEDLDQQVIDEAMQNSQLNIGVKYAFNEKEDMIETFYSSKNSSFPQGTDGWHLNENGVWCDEEGYVVTAMPVTRSTDNITNKYSFNYGDLVETTQGPGRVYDFIPMDFNVVGTVDGKDVKYKMMGIYTIW